MEGVVLDDQCTVARTGLDQGRFGNNNGYDNDNDYDNRRGGWNGRSRFGRSVHGCPDGSRPSCPNKKRPSTCADGSSPTRVWPCSSGGRPRCSKKQRPQCADGTRPQQGQCQDSSKPICTDGTSPLCPDGNAPTRRPVCPNNISVELLGNGLTK